MTLTKPQTEAAIPTIVVAIQIVSADGHIINAKLPIINNPKPARKKNNLLFFKSAAMPIGKRTKIEIRPYAEPIKINHSALTLRSFAYTNEKSRIILIVTQYDVDKIKNSQCERFIAANRLFLINTKMNITIIKIVINSIFKILLIIYFDYIKKIH